MGQRLKETYDRTDKRQAKREQDEINTQWYRVCQEFEDALFKDDFDPKLFQLFSDQWIKWANKFNSKNVISYANPRAFHDEYVNSEKLFGDENETKAHLNYIVI